MTISHRSAIRVHYHEVDGQGRVHNSHYLNYFERGRVEMLRSLGISYREVEESGLMLVVKSMQVDFHYPAEFDDELELTTSLVTCHGARVEHRYEIVRKAGNVTSPSQEPDLKVVSGFSVVACVDRSGKVRRLPKMMQLGIQSEA
jgi:acyl-CoA thioester hydrolase